jgi:ATP-dependent Clp protease adaptor protein ClpS
VFRTIEVKLQLSLVLPLVELIRALAIELSANKPDSQQEAVNVADVRALVSLFADFPKTATIRIDEGQLPRILRACTLLRLHLRKTALAALPDAALESGLDAKQQYGEQQNAVMCYLFLATIIDVALKNLAPRTSPSEQTLQRWWSRLNHLLRRSVGSRSSATTAVRAQHSAKIPDPWQVIVHNDPVNLMSYVTAVFRDVLQLSEDAAKQRMREVHEAKQSIVYTGPRDRAEALARTVQAWHLHAVAQPSDDRVSAGR